VIVILVLLGFALIWLIYSSFWGTPPNINLAVERIGLRMLGMDPELFSSLGLLDNTLLDFHSGHLTDASPAQMARSQHLDRDGLRTIRRFKPEKLSGQEWITYQLMCWYYEQNLRGHRFKYHWVANPVFMGPYPVNQVFGVQLDLINFLSTIHTIKGRCSVRRYIQRLEEVQWKMEGLIQSLQSRAEEDVIPPQFVLEKSLDQVRGLIEMPITENPLYTSLVERMHQTGRLSPRAQMRWAEKAAQIIEHTIQPAYCMLAAELETQLEQVGEGDGVWRLPDGEAYYAFLLRNHTTTDLTADEIHELGIAEVARLMDEVRSVLVELGLPTDYPSAQLKELRFAPKYHYQGEGAGQEILEDYQTILDEVNARMPELFSFGPLDEIVVKRLPEYKELDSPIAYAEAPAMNGSRPGTMWINLRDTDNVYRWGMRTLAYHEGIPGHVYQMAQAQKIKGLPTFRRTFFFNAYIEGWALYAERLAWELGLEDPVSNLGRLQALLWRAARLVVDTGIHAKHWSRQEAIDYMVAVTGLPERDVISEVERYVVMPGQACAYYIGYLKLLALRQKVESTLGEAFSLQDFHDVIINNGGLPLTLLETVVNNYVDKVTGIHP
ncbi:MAG: DUF885 domain-containing protein, partial [Anaerolineaceae bacterium]|nr:DUF885 domain-containing protein [Anaerolineaceae bacterium]